MLNANQDVSNVPFAMQFASLPASTDLMEVTASTYTSSYGTDCGPNSSPDDGQTTSSDD